MKNPILPALFTGASCAVTCLAFAAAAQALAAQTVVLVQDTFTLNETRTGGSNLAGTSPEQQAGSTGNGTWKTGTGSPSGKFSAEGTIVRASDAAENIAVEMRIAIPQPIAVTTVSASIVNATSDWLAIGFLGSDTSSAQAWFGNNDTILWVMIRPSGSWQVFKNATTTTLASGTFSGFSPTATYTLGISYDPTTQMARAFLSDGNTETSLASANDGWFATGLTADTSITATGFRIHPNNNGGTLSGASSVDNFLVTTLATAAIPEPRTATLTLVGLVLSGLAIGRLARR
ncbi:MAG: hypothetical protein LBK99_16400 [Opitutaceae bacterium]|jgi:hypothetical protein|nr:hypothetical protein [Opitutaceae bacterium]